MANAQIVVDYVSSVLSGLIPPGPIGVVVKPAIKLVGDNLKAWLTNKETQKALLQAASSAENDFLERSKEQFGNDALIQAVLSLPLHNGEEFQKLLKSLPSHYNETIVETHLSSGLEKYWSHVFTPEDIRKAAAFYMDCLRIRLLRVPGFADVVVRLATLRINERTEDIQSTVNEINEKLSSLLNGQVITDIIQGYGELQTRYNTSVKNFLEYYLGAEGHPVPFGGREKDLQALDHWFLDEQALHYGLLVAPAGRGKSALLCHWITRLSQREDAPHIIFFPISIRFETHLESVTFSALAARAAYLFNEKVAETEDVGQYRGLFADFLQRPHPDRRPILVVLDGLDEAAGWKLGLDIFPPIPPNHLRVLIAARPLAGDDGPEGWLNRLGWKGRADCIPLGLLDQEGVHDVLVSMGNPLDSLKPKFDVVKTLYDMSEGDPLVIRLYIDALLPQQDLTSLLEAKNNQNLPPGLDGFFELWRDEQRRLWAGKDLIEEEEKVAGLLNLLAVALGPLNHNDILSLGQDFFKSSMSLEGAARSVNRFVIGDGKNNGYVFSHPRLREYFKEKLVDVEIESLRNRFTSYGKNTFLALQNRKISPMKVPSYVLQYYAAHLQEAEAPAESFYELVCQLWARAWLEFDGSYSGFLNDVKRAWEIAKDQDAIEVQLLCALSFSSITSQSGNIPEALLALAVKAGAISIRQALVLLKQSNFSNDGLDKVIGFTENLSDDQLKEVFQQAFTMGRGLSLWGPYMIGVSGIMADEDRSRLPLRDYASLMPPQAWQLAQQVPLDDKDVFTRVAVTIGIFIHTKNADYIHNLLKPDLEEETLGVSILALAPHLPPHLLTKAISIVENFKDEKIRVTVSAALVARLSEPLRQEKLDKVLEAAQNLGDLKDRISALTTLVPHLSPDLLGKVLSAAENIEDEEARAKMLTELAPRLSPHLLTKAISMVENFKDEKIHVAVSAALVARLSEPLRQEKLDKVLEAAQNFVDLEDRVSALTTLMAQLPSDYVGKVLHVVENLEEEEAQAKMLAELAPHLTPDLLIKALSIAENFKDEKACVRVLIALVARLTEPLRQEKLDKALQAIPNISDPTARARALTVLIAYLPERRRREMQLMTLETIQNIQSEGSRAEALIALTAELAGDLWSKALEITQDIGHIWTRIRVLTVLLPKLPELMRQTVVKRELEAAQKVGDGKARAKALITLVPYLSERGRDKVLHEALSIIQNIQDHAERANMLTLLVPLLPEQLRQESIDRALDLANIFRDVQFHAQILTAVTPYLPPALLGKALQMAQDLRDPTLRPQVMGGLARYLSEDLLRQALEGVQKIGEEDREKDSRPSIPSTSEHSKLFYVSLRPDSDRDRAEMLIALAPYLPDYLFERALNEVDQIRDEFVRLRVLIAIIPYLPQRQHNYIIEKAQVSDLFTWVILVATLTPHLPESQRPATLDSLLQTIYQIPHDLYRAEWLVKVGSQLQEPTRQEVIHDALEAIRKNQPNPSQERTLAETLETMSPLLPVSRLNEAFDLALKLHADDNRSQVLAALAPLLPANLLENALEETLRLQGAENRARVLALLTPHLSPDLLEKALQAAVKLREKDDLSRVVAILTPYLSPYQLEKAIQAILAAQNERDSAKDLSVLIPYLDPEAQKFLVNKIMDSSTTLQENRKENISYILTSLKKSTTLPSQFKKDFIKKILEQASRLSRKDFLSLVPDLFTLACSTRPEPELPKLAEKFSLAILDVGEWWP